MSDQPKLKQSINPKLGAYRKAEVMTANREAILLLLYEGAIRFLKQAITAVEKKDYSEKARLVGRTQEIINELRATLNFDAGGEIASTLESLYEFITDRLLKGNQENNAQHLKEALNIISTLHIAWEQAISSLKKNKESNQQP